MQAHVDLYPQDEGLYFRWDLELWLKVAKMRVQMEQGIGFLFKAVEILEIPRDHPKLCWCLDVTGGQGLVDAVEATFEEMGVGAGWHGVVYESNYN